MHSLIDVSNILNSWKLRRQDKSLNKKGISRKMEKDLHIFELRGKCT
jgi:hypothetical protein